jgi:hypothetical protein
MRFNTYVESCGTESVVQIAILCKLRTFERPGICFY